MTQIKSNKAQCGLCKEVIESKYRHDYVTCACGNIFIDGGLAYLRRGAVDMTKFIELSESIDE